MSVTNTKKFTLNRALSFRYDSEKQILFAGYNPPHGKSIEDKKGLLKDLIMLFQKPHTLGSATFKLSAGHHSIQNVTAAIKMALEHQLIIAHKTKISRYDRHDLFASLNGVSIPQEKLLKGKTIAIVGAGGIGSNCAILACSAGIDNIVLIDADRVELSNLTRTTIFGESDIGKFKIAAAKSNIKKLRKKSKIDVYKKPFNSEHLDFYLKVLKNVDTLILSADKAEVHLAALQLSRKLNIPYINAGYAETKGVVGPFYFPENKGCYNCERLLKSHNAISLPELNGKFQAASFGPLNYIVSGVAVSEILKYFWGLKPALTGIRWIYDNIDLTVTKEKIKHHQDCEYCSSQKKD